MHMWTALNPAPAGALIIVLSAIATTVASPAFAKNEAAEARMKDCVSQWATLKKTAHHRDVGYHAFMKHCLSSAPPAQSLQPGAKPKA